MKKRRDQEDVYFIFFVSSFYFPERKKRKQRKRSLLLFLSLFNKKGKNKEKGEENPLLLPYFPPKYSFLQKNQEKEEEMIKKIIAMEKQFWEINVLGGVEPILDGSAATTEYLNSRYSISDGNTVNLSDEIIPVCEEYNRLVEKINELTIAKDAACNHIKNLLKENEVGLAGGYRISWTQVNSTRFDKAKFKEDNPELYGKYMTNSHYRRFSVR